MYKSVDPKPDFPKMERELLEFWYKEKIVDKYLKKNNSSKKIFSFLDGPITANNPMGVHHAWGRTYKDVWQRFFNMRDFKERFQNGFDCQGLWVEVEVEKELGFKSKKDIEAYGIANFVNRCKERVRKFSKVQTEQSKRLGYFMDWDNSYYTMSDENNFMIWHLLKVCWERGWIYKGHESIPWCPRCETAISQHEMLTEDYKELKHETVFFKLPVLNCDFSLLVWTTTPWTIPGNVAVAVNPKFKYKIWKTKTGDKVLILDLKEISDPEALKWFKENVLKDLTETDDKPFKWKDLKNLKYAAPFDGLENVVKARLEASELFHSILEAEDLVVASKGTGLLHIATGAGEEDFKLGREVGLPVISLIGDDAAYLSGYGEFSGENAKWHPEIIINYLKSHENGRYLFKTAFISHRYPVCWRCHTELVWKVADEWYIAMDRKDPSDKKKRTLRKELMDVAKEIKWFPEFGLSRELDWLKNMHDWLISKKNRYWGLALPIYECGNCGNFEVIGGKEELKEKAVSGWDKFDSPGGGNSPHRPWIDEVKIKCPKCNNVVSRIKDVGNPWLDAGIVSFSTLIDPKTKKLSYTTDKKYWREWFPADFITESFPGQFKNWFYSLIVMGTGLEKTAPFKKVLGFGTLLGEDGRPMHKSWGNAVEFNEGADKIGVDVMRWLYVTHNPENNLLFGYKKADEARRKFHLMLWNIYNFFVTYANIDKFDYSKESKEVKRGILDEWILLKLNNLIKDVTFSMEEFDAFSASNKIEEFVDDFSTWYIRRSRDRVGFSAEDDSDKTAFYKTTYKVLKNLCLILAPFIPFISEEIYKNLTGELSVHLDEWPNTELEVKNKGILEGMEKVRQICELAHAVRKAKGIKVRQPLNKIRISGIPLNFDAKLLEILKDEINVKKVELENPKAQLMVVLDTELTAELIGEGEARELVRKIQLKRKELGCRLDEIVNLTVPNWPENYTDFIKKETLAREIIKGSDLIVERL